MQGGGRTAAYAKLLDDIGYGRDMVETAALGNLPPGGGCVDLPGGWVGGPMVMPLVWVLGILFDLRRTPVLRSFTLFVFFFHHRVVLQLLGVHLSC